MPVVLEPKVEMSTQPSMPTPFMFGPDRGAFLREFMIEFSDRVAVACDESVLPDGDKLHWWMSVEFRHRVDSHTREHVFNARMVVFISASMWDLITSSPTAESDLFKRVFARFEERLQEFATREYDRARAGGLLEGVFASAS